MLDEEDDDAVEVAPIEEASAEEAPAAEAPMEKVERMEAPAEARASGGGGRQDAVSESVADFSSGQEAEPTPYFDPIGPARGHSTRLQSILGWRYPSGAPYISRSLAIAFRIAEGLVSNTAPPSEALPPIEARHLLVGIQLLGQHSKRSIWGRAFQNDVLKQDVLFPGEQAEERTRLAEDAHAANTDVDAVVRWDAVEVLAEASRLRQATNTRHEEIGIRHVAAALFLTQGGQIALREQGHLAGYAVLRERMAETMARTLGERYGDSSEAWPAIIERVKAAPLLVRPQASEVRPDYAADVVRIDGPDPLNAAADAEALADVILLKAARPPMAIGMFGPWGSGKSTLMRRLQAKIRDELAEERASRSDAGELGRIRNAIQIEFSAWSFADSENLWAALTAEVFDQLAAGGIDGWRSKPRADLVGAIAARLSREAAILNTASAKATEQAHTAERLRRSLAQAEAQKRSAGVSAALNLAETVLRAAEAKPEADKDAPKKSDLERLKSAIQAPEGPEGSTGPAGALKSLRLIRASARITPTAMNATRRVAGWVLGLAFIVLSGLAVWDALPIRSTISAAWLAAAGLVSVATPYALPGLLLAGQWMSNRAKLRADAEAAAKEARASLDQAEAQLAEAAARAEASRHFVDSFQQGANAPPAPALMLKYLLNESDDLALVRKQIGLINVVRRCFEQLAAVIREMAASDDPDAVDRIVIYIDDLDRCSAKQVVAVLEAIHLLLAFDCFVVVVAVDPKWLAQSLNDRHQQLKDEDKDASGRATPEHYLEKIFQFALQVRPLVDRAPAATAPYGAYRDYAVSLLESDRARAADLADAPVPEAETPRKGVELRKGFVITTPDRPEDVDAARLERVSLGNKETALLLDLGVLAAKSPRAVKRMINVYRLMRIRNADRLEAFLETGAGGGPTYWGVMLALACEIGLPADAMRQLAWAAPRAQDGEWNALLTTLKGPSVQGPALTPDMDMVHKALAAAGLDSAFHTAWKEVEAHIGRSLEVREFVCGLHAVARYSLRALD